MIEQEFDQHGNHRLIDKEAKVASPWKRFGGIAVLRGMFGVTDYYSGKGEMVVTPEEFCAMTQEQEVPLI